MQKWQIVSEGITVIVDAETRDEALFRAGLCLMAEKVLVGLTGTLVDYSGDVPGADALREIKVDSVTEV